MRPRKQGPMRPNPGDTTGIGEDIVRPARPVIEQVMLPRPYAPLSDEPTVIQMSPPNPPFLLIRL